MIDLRSDTLTRPTPGMLAAMAAAEVGDDVYGEDPCVNALQQRVAALLGHEAGLFVPTGSMGNLLGVWLLVPRGQELLCDRQAHVVRAELGAHASLHGVTTRTWDSADGLAPAVTVAAAICPAAGVHLVSTAAISLENTHNFGGGTVQPYPEMQQISEICRDAGVKLHLDGARLWNAHAATGIPLADYGRLFDTVNVCFSKGLGAPVGSMLVSSEENIAKARAQRKRLGGGWRQAGVLAAAAEYALHHHLPRLAEDHRAARRFAEEVARLAPSAVQAEQVQTNIIAMNTGSQPASAVVEASAKAGIRISGLAARAVRAVTHQEISIEQAASAGQVVGQLLAGGLALA